MSKVIKVNPFRVSSIEKAIKELKAVKYVLLQSPSEYVEAISERFNEILNEQAPNEAKGLWEYKLIDGNNGGKTGLFTFKGEVEFIEFGTGIVGKENHDGANMEWATRLPPPYTGYESGKHINPITHTWVYEQNGVHIVTKGQVADPFIYRSVQQVISESGAIAIKVLEKRV